ncbi:MAG TPA: hypothetical protein VHO69_04350 [Phototrophicaceae bacterium]|nr:hypothetical protein [Phototrophicaceae bacterium]
MGGTKPGLKFRFRSSPQTADTFVQAFCDGRLYPGYNPLVAIDSARPAPDALLIRTAGSIHYSRSLGVPDTVWGNRCILRGNWSVYEIVIDRSQTDTYTVSFDLPYDANVNPWEYYPRAEYVAPLGTAYRLYVTGLYEDAPGLYSLTYPTICLITNELPLVWDYWEFHREERPDDSGAVVQIQLDGRPQPSAYITRGSGLAPIGLALDKSTISNYCLTADWTVGTHQVRMVITPPTGTERVFEWDFVVKPQAET